MQTNLLLMLALIDVVAAASDVDGDKTFAKLRTKVGEFIVEGRVASKVEFDALQSEAQALLAEYTDESHERYENPTTHIAPAGLKSDVLRTSTKPSAVPSGTTLRDPFAAENSEDPQAVERLKRADEERGVAYVDGQDVATPSDITAAGVTAESLNVQTSEVGTQDEDTDDKTGNDDDKSDNDDEEAGDDAAENEVPDWDNTNVPDIKAYLDQEKVDYTGLTKKADLIPLAQKAWEDAVARSADADKKEAE